MSFRKCACVFFCAVIMLLSVPISASAAFSGDERIVIALDPGHGGANIGSAAYGVGEKIYTYRLATCLKQYLEESGSFIVHMTRDGDYDLEICERGIFANDCNADALISLHFDGSVNSSQNGVTVYTSVFDSTALVTLGNSIASNVASSVGMASNGVKRKSDTEGYYWNTERQWDIKDSSLGVLSDYYGIPTWAAKFGIPSMIVEHGFLSSPYDRDIISAEGSIEKMARAEADAIIAYYTNHTHSYGAMRRDYPSNCVFIGKQSEHCTVCGHRRNIQLLDPAYDNHYWQDAATTPASCGHDGAVTRKCRITENLIEKGYKNIATHENTEIIPAPTQHNFVSVAEVAATHTRDGYIQYKCTNCGESYRDVLYAEGHSYESVRYAEATCTENGGYIYQCKVCGDEYMEADTYARGHSYTVLEETLPTCTEAGFRKSECGVCAHILNEELAATGHDTSMCQRTEPTCTENGSLTGTCAVCGAEINEVYTAAGHSFNSLTVKEATCLEAGQEERTCSVCGYSDVHTVDALGHDFLMASYKAPTCTDRGATEFVCRGCGSVHRGGLKPAGHHWETLSIKEPRAFISGSERIICRGCGTMRINELRPSAADTAICVFGIFAAVCLTASIILLVFSIARRKRTPAVIPQGGFNELAEFEEIKTCENEEINI